MFQRPPSGGNSQIHDPRESPNQWSESLRPDALRQTLISCLSAPPTTSAAAAATQQQQALRAVDAAERVLSRVCTDLPALFDFAETLSPLVRDVFLVGLEEAIAASSHTEDGRLGSEATSAPPLPTAEVLADKQQCLAFFERWLAQYTALLSAASQSTMHDGAQSLPSFASHPHTVAALFDTIDAAMATRRGMTLLCEQLRRAGNASSVQQTTLNASLDGAVKLSRRAANDVLGPLVTLLRLPPQRKQPLPADECEQVSVIVTRLLYAAQHSFNDYAMVNQTYRALRNVLCEYHGLVPATQLHVDSVVRTLVTRIQSNFEQMVTAVVWGRFESADLFQKRWKIIPWLYNELQHIVGLYLPECASVGDAFVALTASLTRVVHACAACNAALHGSEAADSPRGAANRLLATLASEPLARSFDIVHMFVTSPSVSDAQCDQLLRAIASVAETPDDDAAERARVAAATAAAPTSSFDISSSPLNSSVPSRLPNGHCACGALQLACDVLPLFALSPARHSLAWKALDTMVHCVRHCDCVALLVAPQSSSTAGADDASLTHCLATNLLAHSCAVSWSVFFRSRFRSGTPDERKRLHTSLLRAALQPHPVESLIARNVYAFVLNHSDVPTQRYLLSFPITALQSRPPWSRALLALTRVALAASSPATQEWAWQQLVTLPPANSNASVECAFLQRTALLLQHLSPASLKGDAVSALVAHQLMPRLKPALLDPSTEGCTAALLAWTRALPACGAVREALCEFATKQLTTWIVQPAIQERPYLVSVALSSLATCVHRRNTNQPGIMQLLHTSLSLVQASRCSRVACARLVAACALAPATDEGRAQAAKLAHSAWTELLCGTGAVEWLPVYEAARSFQAMAADTRIQPQHVQAMMPSATASALICALLTNSQSFPLDSPAQRAQLQQQWRALVASSKSADNAIVQPVSSSASTFTTTNPSSNALSSASTSRSSSELATVAQTFASALHALRASVTATTPPAAAVLSHLSNDDVAMLRWLVSGAK